MRRCLALIFCFTVLHSEFIYAQDTTFRYYPQFTKYYLVDHPDTAIEIDTSIMSFNRFHPAEIPFGYLHLGYLGAPTAPMYLTLNTNPDIDIGFHQFDQYWRAAENVRLYDTREPYTSFAYQQGTKSEIRVNIIHTQNITPHLSLGVDFNRNRTDGWYLQQQSKISNLDAFLRYTSPNNFYRGTLIYILNDLKMQQNGGVTTDSIFSSSEFFNKSLVPVALQAANSQWKNDQIVMTNAINFGKHVQPDKKDTTQTVHIIPRIRLQERFEWEKRKYSFTDEKIDSAFYPNPQQFPDSGIRDSLVYNLFMNEFRISKFREDSAIHKVNFSADAWFRHSLYYIHNKSLGENFQSGIVGADFTTSFYSKLYLHAEGGLNLLGRNQGDFQLKANLTYEFMTKRKIIAEGLLASNHPSVVADQYVSAMFNWNNNFTTLTTTMLSGSYVDERWNLALKFSILAQSNYIYWDINSSPVQYNGTLSGFQIYLMKDIRVWRMHLDNEVAYQKYSSDQAVAFPELIIREGLYYYDNVFHGALQVKAGFDITWRGKYNAPAFQPATGQFLIQHYEDVSYFPVADLYVTVKVRSLRAFAELQNVNQDLGYSGNFSAYHYPMPDRSFKVGFQWLFWN